MDTLLLITVLASIPFAALLLFGGLGFIVKIGVPRIQALYDSPHTKDPAYAGLQLTALSSLLLLLAIAKFDCYLGVDAVLVGGMAFSVFSRAGRSQGPFWIQLVIYEALLITKLLVGFQTILLTIGLGVVPLAAASLFVVRAGNASENGS